MADEENKLHHELTPVLFPEFVPVFKSVEPKKLKVDPKKLSKVGILASQSLRNELEVIPQPILPTRWEYLQPKIENNNIPLTTIIHPVDQAMEVIRGVVESLRTTGGCQVFVIRADTGSGKTTFLNTLPHYMHDITFKSKPLTLKS